MSRKNRKHAGVTQSDVDVTSAIAQIENLQSRRQCKEALKLAKVLFQREPIPVHRVLVERAYYCRFEQLCRGGMREGAIQVAVNLLEFGITDATLIADFALHLPELGMGDKAAALASRIEAPEARLKLAAKAADQAVLHPDKIGAHQNDLQTGVLAVRGALAALDAKDEPLAWEQLRDVPRSSPFADWRLFVRGLAALRRGDAAQVAANWDRLDPDRAAHKIARLLRPAERSGDTAPASTGGQQLSKSSWLALETKAFGEPVTARLEELQAAVQEQNWREFRKLAGPLSAALKRIDVRLAERLTELLIRPVVDAENDDYSDFSPGFLVDILMSSVMPCRLDPRWNRMHAILCECDRETREEACTYWKQYAADVDKVSHLTAEERRKMQALVYRHMGELYGMMADPGDDSPFERPVHKKTSKRLQRQSVESLEESLRLDPTARTSYERLEQFYNHWDQPEKVAATAKRLLAVFPDDLPTLELLIGQQIRRQEFDAALPLVERARRLKPLDEWIAIDELRVWQGLARQHALAGRWDKGRAELARVRAAWRDNLGREPLWARMAAFEFSAGETDRAEELVREGEAMRSEPAEFWLHMSIESIRYHLAPRLEARFADSLKRGLAKKVQGETAAGLSSALGANIASRIDYPGQEKHIRSVVACLKRSATGKYKQSELIDVCQLLILLPHEEELFEKLVRKGVKAFPDSIYFLTHDAKIEFALGPYEANRARMLKHLERALELLEQTQDPREIALGDTIRELLGPVRNMMSERSGMSSRMPFGMPDVPPEMFGMFEQMFDSLPGDQGDDGEYYEAEDFGDAGSFFGSFGKPARKGPSNRRSR
jgi:tetratricopeptide (TPR) repeat protein